MKNELIARTKKFAVDVINFVNSIPYSQTSKVIINQLIRAATSVGANYRAAQRAKSGADFSYKIKVVEEEADETIYWLELILEAKLLNDNTITDELLKEANELTAIFSSISIKLKSRKQN